MVVDPWTRSPPPYMGLVLPEISELATVSVLPEAL
jgi:hypothetical protein